LLWSSASTPKSVVPTSRLYDVSQPPPPPPGGTGTGLTGEYFDNQDFTSLKVTRVDPTVNFSWGSGSPASGVGKDTFSVRWTGQVEPEFSETYAFYTVSDDGVRLWVNGQLLIDNWTDHASTEDRGTIVLAAGQTYDIRMDFYEKGGGAIAKLLWSSASTPKAAIPEEYLYPSP
ncbi:MAG: PA14 domain-containing protein, partial [Thermoanaerobaculia bacterium]